MPLAAVERAPGEVRGHQIALAVLALVFQRNEKAFRVVGTDVHTGTTHQDRDLFTTTDANLLGGTGVAGKLVGDVLCACIHPHCLLAAPLTAHLHTPENGRSGLDKG